MERTSAPREEATTGTRQASVVAGGDVSSVRVVHPTGPVECGEGLIPMAEGQGRCDRPRMPPSSVAKDDLCPGLRARSGGLIGRESKSNFFKLSFLGRFAGELSPQVMLPLCGWQLFLPFP